MACQKFGDFLGVAVVSFNAQGQCFQALGSDPCVEGRGGCTGVAKESDSGFEPEGSGAEVGVAEAVVGGVGCDKVGEYGGTIAFNGPVELPTVDEDTAESGAVAGVELGQGCDNDVSTEFKGADECCSGERVVHNERNAVGVCHLGDGGNVEDVGLGVGEGFAVEGDGVVLDGSLPGGRIVGVVHEGGFYSQAGEGDGE